MLAVEVQGDFLAAAAVALVVGSTGQVLGTAGLLLLGALCQLVWSIAE